MKQTIKRILPILLSLIVICSIIWYLFAYDRGFMQDVLLGSARYFEKQGNHAIATWLYNQAYTHSGNDDGVIIELAERFKKLGNYTQAEVVLADAIAEGGSAELYIALCRTYVEQDKLLDAVEMLENITNPEMKAKLDEMRPSTPVATPDAGFYNQYLNVSIVSGEGDRLYIGTKGDFPSIERPYTDAIALVGGENHIYAVAVNENGLVSVPSYFSYIIGGVIEEITVTDSVLNSHYRELLNMGASEKLFSDDLWTITSLTVPKGVTDYSSLGRLSYLETLVIENQDIKGLQMLSSLTQLKHLTIRNCPLSATDLSIIGGLPNLEKLTLSGCSLSNITGLSGAAQLVNLDLSNNAIKDLSPLSFMSKLTTLNMSGNALTNLSPLSALSNLTDLDVSYNSLTSLAPLGACPKLNVLTATNNQIAEIPIFQNTSVLTTLTLANNDITNVQNISLYTSLTGLSLSYNQLTDVSSLSALINLTSVDLSHNQIVTLPSWNKDCALVEIDASHNQIASVTPLRGLAMLNYVTLDYNKITNVNPLAECAMLVRVSIYGNSVKDVSRLTDMSVIVNYNPK